MSFSFMLAKQLKRYTFKNRTSLVIFFDKSIDLKWIFLWWLHFHSYHDTHTHIHTHTHTHTYIIIFVPKSKACIYLCYRKAEDGSTFFGGWARMAQPIVSFSVVEVSIIYIIPLSKYTDSLYRSLPSLKSTNLWNLN